MLFVDFEWKYAGCWLLAEGLKKKQLQKHHVDAIVCMHSVGPKGLVVWCVPQEAFLLKKVLSHMWLHVRLQGVYKSLVVSTSNPLRTH